MTRRLPKGSLAGDAYTSIGALSGLVAIIMTKRHTRLVNAPPDSAISSWFPGAYLLDSYSAKAASSLDLSMRDLLQLVLTSQPAWIRGLLALRDAAVRPFGIRTADRLQKENPSDDSFGFFSVLDERMDEIILGGDDKHLDFRLSLMRRPLADEDELLLTTVVRVHGFLGRAYIHAIHPFHHIVVRRTLLRLCRLLDARVTGETTTHMEPLG